MATDRDTLYRLLIDAVFELVGYIDHQRMDLHVGDLGQVHGDKSNAVVVCPPALSVFQDAVEDLGGPRRAATVRAVMAANALSYNGVGSAYLEANNRLLQGHLGFPWSDASNLAGLGMKALRELLRVESTKFSHVSRIVYRQELPKGPRVSWAAQRQLVWELSVQMDRRASVYVDVRLDYFGDPPTYDRVVIPPGAVIELTETDDGRVRPTPPMVGWESRRGAYQAPWP